MATNTRLVTFNAQNVTPQDDGLLYETAIPQTGIIYGASMTVNGTNTIHITTGFGIVRGRFFEIFDSDIPVPLSASGEVPGRVIGRLDLANTGAPFVLEAQTGSLSPLRQDADVNIFNGVHEFLLAEFFVNEITISDFQDVHPVVEEGKINTRWNAGLVPKGDGHPKKKWATDDLGNPAWDTDYMEEILGDFATIEGDIASKAYNIGDFLVKDGLLYKVIAAISAGNVLTVGGNIAQTNVGNEISYKTASMPIGNRTGRFYKFGRVVYFTQPNVVTIGEWRSAGAIPVGFRPVEYCILSLGASPTAQLGVIAAGAGGFVVQAYTDDRVKVAASGVWLTLE